MNTGVPPLSRARDILRDGVVHYRLVPVFGRVRALGLRAARLPASMPQTPARVFVSQYPEGYQSGTMAAHRDTMVAHVAVTLVVTNDAEDGCFCVASAAGVTRAVPLAEGWAVAVDPDTWHGVEEILRVSKWISITFFF